MIDSEHNNQNRSEDEVESTAGSIPSTAMPTKFTHSEYNENLYEWTERGVENPHEHSWSTVFYTCQFCPARGDTPDDVNHSRSCPVHPSNTDPSPL